MVLLVEGSDLGVEDLRLEGLRFVRRGVLG